MAVARPLLPGDCCFGRVGQGSKLETYSDVGFCRSSSASFAHSCFTPASGHPTARSVLNPRSTPPGYGGPSQFRRDDASHAGAVARHSFASISPSPTACWFGGGASRVPPTSTFVPRTVGAARGSPKAADEVCAGRRDWTAANSEAATQGPSAQSALTSYNSTATAAQPERAAQACRRDK